MCIKSVPSVPLTSYNCPLIWKKKPSIVTCKFFKLHRLPIPRPGQVLGLVGTNGIGKSTALVILLIDENRIWVNLICRQIGRTFWHFAAPELQNYFQQNFGIKFEGRHKPQFVELP